MQRSQTHFLELQIEDTFSPVFGDTITIPPHTIMWRGYDSAYPVISSRPAYYSMREIANGYASSSTKSCLALGAFYSTKQLQLLDFRFLQVILKQLFENSRNKYTEQDRNVLLSVQTSFGLCSLGHQLELMHHIYKSETQTMLGYLAMENAHKSNKILEQPGVRVGETNVDGFTMYFLQALFENIHSIHIDGFISPRLPSPFHYEKTPNSMSPEIIIFNPIQSQIQEMNTSLLPPNLPKLSIRSLLYKFNVIAFDYGHFTTSIHMQKGGAKDTYEPGIETFNRMLNTNDKNTIQLARAARSAGKRWANRVPPLARYEAPAPSYPLAFPSKCDMELN